MRDGPCLWVEEASYEWRQTLNKPCHVSLRAQLLVDLGP